MLLTPSIDVPKGSLGSRSFSIVGSLDATASVRKHVSGGGSSMNARYAWLLTVAALSGCVRQYLSPQFDPSGAQFKGVASYLHDASAVQVVFVHGMCTHSEDKWVNQVWEPQILDALEAVIGEKKLEARECTEQSKYCIVPRSYSIGKKQLDARFLLWSGSTAEAKTKLHFDERPRAVTSLETRAPERTNQERTHQRLPLLPQRRG